MSKKKPKEKLKSCPFCGAKDPDIEICGTSGYFVECPDCSCSLGWYPANGIFRTEWLAKMAWNTRV